MGIADLHLLIKGECAHWLSNRHLLTREEANAVVLFRNSVIGYREEHKNIRVSDADAFHIITATGWPSGEIGYGEKGHSAKLISEGDDGMQLRAVGDAAESVHGALTNLLDSLQTTLDSLADHITPQREGSVLEPQGNGRVDMED